MSLRVIAAPWTPEGVFRHRVGVVNLKRAPLPFVRRTPVLSISRRSPSLLWTRSLRSDLHQHHRSSLHPAPRSPFLSCWRAFHSTPKTNDIFFVTVPAVKSVLLSITRVTLILIPLAYRWGVFRRFPVASRPLVALPIISLCLVLALGLSQSPRTARWRLLVSLALSLDWGIAG